MDKYGELSPRQSFRAIMEEKRKQSNEYSYEKKEKKYIISEMAILEICENSKVYFEKLAESCKNEQIYVMNKTYESLMRNEEKHKELIGFFQVCGTNIISKEEFDIFDKKFHIVNIVTSVRLEAERYEYYTNTNVMDDEYYKNMPLNIFLDRDIYVTNFRMYKLTDDEIIKSISELTDKYLCEKYSLESPVLYITKNIKITEHLGLKKDDLLKQYLIIEVGFFLASMTKLNVEVTFYDQREYFKIYYDEFTKQYSCEDIEKNSAEYQKYNTREIYPTIVSIGKGDECVYNFAESIKEEFSGAKYYCFGESFDNAIEFDNLQFPEKSLFYYLQNLYESGIKYPKEWGYYATELEVNNNFSFRDDIFYENEKVRYEEVYADEENYDAKDGDQWLLVENDPEDEQDY